MRRHFRTVDHWDHVPIYPTTIGERLRYEVICLESEEDIVERIEEQVDDMLADYDYWLRDNPPVLVALPVDGIHQQNKHRTLPLHLTTIHE
jgi:hypothetical protein